MLQLRRTKPRLMDRAVYDLLKEAEVMAPRHLSLETEDLLTDQTIEDILDLLKCPICLDVMDSPSRVRDCGHMFCRECAEKYSRLFKPAHCALCRNSILSRRDLRNDSKL